MSMRRATTPMDLSTVRVIGVSLAVELIVTVSQGYSLVLLLKYSKGNSSHCHHISAVPGLVFLHIPEKVYCCKMQLSDLCPVTFQIRTKKNTKKE